MHPINRRHILCKASQTVFAAGIAGLAIGSRNTFADETTSKTELNRNKDFPIAIFTKVFQKHSFSQLADAISETGADGIEATIRGGGHIEPAQADTKIPEMVAALAKNEKRLLIAATGINEANKESEKVLRVLRDNNVGFYRMGYYRYAKLNKAGSALQQVKNASAKAKDLADMNREIGIVGLYQNHFGKDYVGNLLWDLTVLLDGVDRTHLGIALDLRHLRGEIAGSYQTAVDAVRPHLRSVYLKDTIREGKLGSTLREVPLGEGMVGRDLFRDAFDSIQPAPLCIHVEYFGQNPIDVEKIGPVVEAYRRDVTTLRKWMS